MPLLTAPVRGVSHRLHPPWLNALMVALPPLAVAGSWGGPFSLTAFRLAVVLLAGVAAWDWWRHRDRSRTGWATWGLAVMFAISGGVSWAVWRPDGAAAGAELVALAVVFAGCLALVQLYRGRPTLIGMCRGWLLALALILTGYAIEAVTGLRLRPGPQGASWFPDATQLVAAVVAALLVFPIGVTVEPRRWVRHAYRAAAGATVVAALVPPGPSVLARTWDSLVISGGWSAPITALVAGWWMLRNSDFLGMGPASFDAVLASGRVPGVPTEAEVHWAIPAVMGQYGLGVTIVGILAWAGLGRRAVQRLTRTPGLSLSSPARGPAVWALVWVVLWPVLAMAGSSWLAQPVAAVQMATVVLLARHLERPRGRRPIDDGEPDLI